MVLDLLIKTLIIPCLPAIGKKNALLSISRADASDLPNVTLQIADLFRDALLPLTFCDQNWSTFTKYAPRLDDSAEVASATAARDAALREMAAAQEEVAALKQQVQGLQSELAAAREAAAAADAKLQEGSDTTSHSEKEASHPSLSQAGRSKGSLWKAVQQYRRSDNVSNAAAQPSSEI